MSKSKVTSAGSDASSPRSVSAGRRKQVHPCDLPTTHIPALGRETVQSPESVSRTPPHSCGTHQLCLHKCQKGPAVSEALAL